MATSTHERIDLSRVDTILERWENENGAVIPILQEIQEAYGYLPREALAHVGERLRVPFTQLYGVATFYSQFHLARRGKNLIKVCDGTACHVRGAGRTMDALGQELGVGPGSTTEDYQFTWEVIYCLGACALAPVVVVNGEAKGRCTAERMHAILSELRD